MLNFIIKRTPKIAQVSRKSEYFASWKKPTPQLKLLLIFSVDALEIITIKRGTKENNSFYA